MAKDALKKSWEHKIPLEIINAFFSVPRERFMPQSLKLYAYEDHAFPIDFGQTISQPTTVVSMLALLEPKKSDKVLEIGAGSGFNAAILSRLCKEIYTLEIIPELAAQARKTLSALGIKSVKVVNANGYEGYKPKAPYDKIIATAAAEEIPKALGQQLKEGGILVIPVGRHIQTMKKCIKQKNRLICTSHGEYLFVEFRKSQ